MLAMCSNINRLYYAHEIVISASNMYGVSAMAQLEKESAAIPDCSEQIILMQGVRQTRHLTEEMIAAIDAHIEEEEASQNPDAQLLLSMTGGVGTYILCTAAPCIRDWRHLKVWQSKAAGLMGRPVPRRVPVR